MKNQYELAILISEKLTEEKAKELVKKIKNFLKKEKIAVKKEDWWGKKPLAYPIEKNEYAFYVFLKVLAEPAQASKVYAELKEIPAIIRFMILLEEKKVKEPTKTVAKKKRAKAKEEKIAKEIEREKEKMKLLEKKLEEILKE